MGFDNPLRPRVDHSPATPIDLRQAELGRGEKYRQERSTAVLAITFTDIVRSTELREQMGEVHYEEFREEHDALTVSIVERDAVGAVVKSTGDGVLAVFSEPSTAVERALELQERLLNHPFVK